MGRDKEKKAIKKSSESIVVNRMEHQNQDHQNPVNGPELEEMKRQERQLRTKRLKESCQVRMPEETILKHSFARVSTETKSAKKRKTRSHMLGSELYRKRVNAEEVEAAEEAWKNTVRQRAKKADIDISFASEKEQEAIRQFLTKDKDTNLFILNSFRDIANAERPLGQACIQQFMNLDLKLDLRTDQTFAKESVRMEEIFRKTEALKLLIKAHPDFTSLLSEDERIDLQEKLKIAESISDYYRMQKKVITNSYYRTHYRSEISARYDENDTLEQRNLTMLLYQAEQLRTRKEMAGTADLSRRLLYYQVPREENDKANADGVYHRFRDIPINPEYGKNDPDIEDSPHAAYFRQLNTEDSVVYRRLKAERYRVVGMDVEMKESFVRHISNLPRWKAIQQAPREQVVALIENLSSTPVHPEDPQEVEACKQRNLEGMRQFKALIKRQVNYLKRKYGCGLLLISSKELVRHVGEFENDFTNMQGLTEFVDYLKKLPGMYDETDETDVEMERLLKYYQLLAYSEVMNRYSLVQDRGKNIMFSDYKFRIINGIMGDHDILSDQIETSDTMHLDVRWDTVFDENDVRMEEVLKVIQSPNLEKRMNEIDPQAVKDGSSWPRLFADTRELPPLEATRRLLEKAVAPEVEDHREEWRRRGLVFGSIMPGVGKYDFDHLNEIYHRIVEEPEVREQYGITTPELFEEFRTNIEAYADAGEYLSRNDLFVKTAFEMQDRIHQERVNAPRGLSRAMLHRLETDLGTVADQYLEQNTNYRKDGEGNQIYNQFRLFRERIDMWSYPEHREVMRTAVEPEIEKQVPDQQVTISGQEYAVYAGEITAELKGRRLKEGTDPQEFAKAVKEYNDAYGRFKVFKRIVDSGADQELMEGEPLWQAVETKKPYFQYDIYNRLVTCCDRWQAALERMKDMTE